MGNDLQPRAGRTAAPVNPDLSHCLRVSAVSVDVNFRQFDLLSLWPRTCSLIPVVNMLSEVFPSRTPDSPRSVAHRIVLIILFLLLPAFAQAAGPLQRLPNTTEAIPYTCVNGRRP